MTDYRTSHEFPCSQDQLFDLVADIERYPDFLPGWHEARIIRREPDLLEVEQALGLGPVRFGFTSRARLESPARIHITSSDGPFARLSIDWHITADSPDRCTATLAVHYTARNTFWEQLMSTPFNLATRQLITLFEQRVREVYPPTGPE